MTNLSNLFDRCGGIRAMAEIVGEPPSTVQSWKNAGRVPSTKQPKVLERVAAAGIPICAEDVIWPCGKPPVEADPQSEAA